MREGELIATLRNGQPPQQIGDERPPEAAAD
jgi:hypothetical protein